MINFSERGKANFNISVIQQALPEKLTVSDSSNVHVKNIASSISGPAIIYMTVHAVPGSHVLLRRDVEIHISVPYYISTSYEKKIVALLDQQGEKKRLAVYGTTGSGKTILAKNYLQAYEKTYHGHLTKIITAASLEEWEWSLQNWAESLDSFLTESLKEEKNQKIKKKLIINAIKTVLNDTSWCIVIDNWDKRKGPGFSELENVFNVGQGTWILTTQHSSPFPEEECSLNLGKGLLAEDESKWGEGYALLTKVMEPIAAQFPQLGTEKERQTLANSLNNLPLALVQAGSYILWENKKIGNPPPFFTYLNYLELLNEKTEEIIEKSKKILGEKANIPRESESDYAEFKKVKTQEAAIALSLKNVLQIDEAQPNIHLWHILCFCAFLASERISLKLIKDYLQTCLPNEASSQIEVVVSDALVAAEDYSIFQYEEKNFGVGDIFDSLHIHRVTQKVLRDICLRKLLINAAYFLQPNQQAFINEEDARRNYYAINNNFFNKHLTQMLKKKELSVIRKDYLHIESWCKHSTRESPSKEQYMDGLLLQSVFAQAVYWLGDYILSKKIFANILTDIVTFFPDEKLLQAKMQRGLAIVLNSLEEYEEAEKAYLCAIKVQINYFKTENHREVAITKDNLAILLEDTGRYADAEKYYKEALLACKFNTENANLEDISRIQHNYANTLERLGEYVDAETLCRESLEARKKLYKENSANIARSKENLGRILGLMGRFEEAKTYCQEALDTLIIECGESNSDVALAQQNLSIILTNLGHFEKAEELQIQALKIHKANFLTAAITKNHLSRTLKKLGRYPEAETECLEALEIQTNSQKNVHIMVIANTKENLALIYLRQDRYDEAKKLLWEVLAIKKLYYGEQHIGLARAQRNLAETIITLNSQDDQAEILCRNALDVQVRFYPQDCTEISKTLYSFKKILHKLEKNEDTDFYDEAIISGCLKRNAEYDLEQARVYQLQIENSNLLEEGKRTRMYGFSLFGLHANRAVMNTSAAPDSSQSGGNQASCCCLVS